MVENQFGRQLKSIKTNNGGEYVSHKLISFCDKRGIKQQLIVSYTPNQNGVVECMNQDSREIHIYAFYGKPYTRLLGKGSNHSGSLD